MCTEGVLGNKQARVICYDVDAGEGLEDHMDR